MRSIRLRLITVFTAVIIIVNLSLGIVAISMFSNRVTQDTFDDLSWGEKVEFFEQEARSRGYKAFVLTDFNGTGKTLNAEGSATRVESEAFFRQALQGQPILSDVIIHKSTNETDLIFAVPIIRNTKIDGVFYGICDGMLLSNLINDTTYG